jgi:protein phosphatase
MGSDTYVERNPGADWATSLFPVNPLDSHRRSGFKIHLVDDLMAIGEFSDRSGLSVKRLRTYAAEGLLAPAAVDPASGYRYYSPGQLADAQVIDALRQAGVPLADIRALLRQPSRELFDAWARQLHTDAQHRQEALTFARHLLTASEDPIFPTPHSAPREGHMTTLRTAGRTDIGRLRENNEDAIVHSDRLVLVADGMGGHPGGEIAANVAAGVVPAVFTGQSADELEAAVRAANWAIRERADAQAGLEGMGTTICVAGLLATGHLALVNVGDSRAYLWHEGALSRLTQDHSLTAELIGRGELREEDAVQHPLYGVLTRALGVGPDVEIDRTTLALGEGDRIVVCSDGLFNELSGEEIAHVMAGAGDVAVLVDNLIDRAITHGGHDNVSVVVAEVAA